MDDSVPVTFISPTGTKVSSHRHTNPDGTRGGWVAENSDVSPKATVEFGAIVGPGVLISGASIIRAGDLVSADL
jgi:UDP-3-O-[3-hydroxymyristoyl] glucosamine N-acyltransferase